MPSNKYLAAFLSIGITIVAALTSTTAFSWPIVVQLAILTVTSISTYLLPVVPGRWSGALKTGTEVVGAILAAAAPFVLVGHITGAQIAVVILAALKALGTELGVAARVAADVLPEQPLPVQTPAV